MTHCLSILPFNIRSENVDKFEMNMQHFMKMWLNALTCQHVDISWPSLYHLSHMLPCFLGTRANLQLSYHLLASSSVTRGSGGIGNSKMEQNVWHLWFLDKSVQLIKVYDYARTSCIQIVSSWFEIWGQYCNHWNRFQAASVYRLCKYLNGGCVWNWHTSPSVRHSINRSKSNVGSAGKIPYVMIVLTESRGSWGLTSKEIRPTDFVGQFSTQ